MENGLSNAADHRPDAAAEVPNDTVPIPSSWASNTVVGKSYSIDDADGLKLWEAVIDRSGRWLDGASEQAGDRYGAPILVKPRLGQGAFRVLVTDAYGRQYAITGEKTLPILDAAHIRSFASGGECQTASNVDP